MDRGFPARDPGVTAAFRGADAVRALRALIDGAGMTRLSDRRAAGAGDDDRRALRLLVVRLPPELDSLDRGAVGCVVRSRDAFHRDPTFRLYFSV
jgi:hypothetical protein